MRLLVMPGETSWWIWLVTGSLLAAGLAAAACPGGVCELEACVALRSRG